MASKKLILVTGCPRSGTKTYASALRRCGIDAPHEQTGKDGTVSCYFFTPDNVDYPRSSIAPPHSDGSLFRDIDFKYRVHLVRNPLLCIASGMGVVSRYHLEWLHKLGVVSGENSSKLKRLMEMWLIMNKEIQRYATITVQIEDQLDGFERVLRRIGGTIPENFEWKHLHKSRKDSMKLTIDDLINEDKALTKDIINLSKSLGYKL